MVLDGPTFWVMTGMMFGQGWLCLMASVQIPAASTTSSIANPTPSSSSCYFYKLFCHHHQNH
jgi:hypothetical protein